MLVRLWLVLAGLNGAMAVGAGAYGWHGLGGDVMFEMASTYQLVHAAALVGVALLATVDRDRLRLATTIAGTCFVLGIVLFSGTLYALVLTQTVLISGAAPLGGFLLISGWLSLVWTGLKMKSQLGDG